MAQLRNFLPGAEPVRDTPQPEHDDSDFLGSPVTIGGEPSGYYPIRSLAAALNRSPGTIRDWETAGVIPESYVLNKDSRNGRRRLYTRAQILMLRRLAAEYGILDNHRAIVKDSEFSRLSFVLFDRLRREEAA